MKHLTVLGSTGSIGQSTLDVCRQHPERFNVVALAANKDVEAMFQQCTEFKPEYAVMADEEAARQLQTRLHADQLQNIQVLGGREALNQVAKLDQVDMVMAAIVGAAGLISALSAVKAGKVLLLANKEALVVSGNLFIQAAREHQATIIPIDSEHNAIYQCMPADFSSNFSSGISSDPEDLGITRLLLTASGGPFLNKPTDQLKDVTPEQAVAHPNWDMGKKISVDSATMMNKGLEVIEARWLFNAGPDKIQVVVHPQSVIHSMVEYADGSVLAQMGNPDMRTPIAHAMAYPQRISSGVKPLNLFDIARLDFVKPDFQQFPCLGLAFDALREKDSAPAVLNAANEMTVAAFLDNKIRFTDIAAVNAEVLSGISPETSESIEHLMDIDLQARSLAEKLIAKRSI